MPDSDFQSGLRLWEAVHRQRRDLSGNRFRRWCREHFLSYLRVREWHDVHAQLRAQCRELGLRSNEQPADYPSLHRALLSGFLGHIGHRDEERRYDGPRGRRFVLGPGSVLHQKPPPWVVAAELVETSRVYAHTAARVEPRWIEEAAGPLVRRSYEVPAWDPERGHVVARETVSLYGLVLASGRRVDYGRVDPGAARRIFIEEALVAGRHGLDAAFARHNRALRDRVREVEHRLRRRDLLADDRRQAAFFEDRLPAEVVDVRTLERWRRRAEAERPDCLHMQLPDLLAGELPAPDPAQWPDELVVEGNRFALRYRFDPGAEDDGITMSVPAALLPMIDEELLDWLVPGLLEEKVVALIRGLPKSLRRRLVPAPDVARRCLEHLRPGEGSLRGELARLLTRESGTPVTPDAWDDTVLPPHLMLNLAVVGDDGRLLGQGRALAELQARFTRGGHVRVQSDAHAPRRMTEWDVADLPRTVRVRDEAGARHLYPALRDEGEAVTLRYYADRVEAEQVHAAGVLRLFMLALGQQRKYLEKTFRGMPGLAAGNDSGGPVSLVADLVRRSFREALQRPDDPVVRGRRAFEERLEQRRAVVVAQGMELAELVTDILARRRRLRGRLASGLKGPGAEAAAAAIEEQLDALVSQEFLRDTPDRWLRELPRFLEAIDLRIDKLAAGNPRDARNEAAVRPFWERWQAAADRSPRDPELVRFRWLIEEFRVSLFAQSLGTSEKVSAARLEQQWERTGPAGHRSH